MKPLSSEPNGNWKSFFKDNEVLLQIDKDCQRLCPDIEFFRRTTDYSSFVLFGSDVPTGILRRRCENCFLQVNFLKIIFKINLCLVCVIKFMFFVNHCFFSIYSLNL